MPTAASTRRQSWTAKTVASHQYEETTGIKGEGRTHILDVVAALHGARVTAVSRGRKDSESEGGDGGEAGEHGAVGMGLDERAEVVLKADSKASASAFECCCSPSSTPHTIYANTVRPVR